MIGSAGAAGGNTIGHYSFTFLQQPRMHVIAHFTRRHDHVYRKQITNNNKHMVGRCWRDSTINANTRSRCFTSTATPVVSRSNGVLEAPNLKTWQESDMEWVVWWWWWWCPSKTATVLDDVILHHSLLFCCIIDTGISHEYGCVRGNLSTGCTARTKYSIQLIVSTVASYVCRWHYLCEAAQDNTLEFELQSNYFEATISSDTFFASPHVTRYSPDRAWTVGGIFSLWHWARGRPSLPYAIFSSVCAAISADEYAIICPNLLTWATGRPFQILIPITMRAHGLRVPS